MLNEVTDSYVIDGNLLLNCGRYQFPKRFDCGVELINSYFKSSLKRALRSENFAGIGAVTASGAVVGFCTLALCSLERDRVSSHLEQANLPSQVSVIRLVMLGVDKGYQGLGIGRQLLRKAFMQAISVHRQIPIKGIYLDAAPGAVSFYEELGFKPLTRPDESSGTPMLLNIQALLRAF
jgi:GNAT superfamily N-acetyltransferase